jgi:hypothetical protein
MPDMMSQLSSSVSTTNVNPSFGYGGTMPPFAPFSFGGGHIPQTNPTVGGWNSLSSGPNPNFNALGWSTQPGGQFTSYIIFFIPSSSMLIPVNTFIMANPTMSSGFPFRGCQFQTMRNPQHRVPSAGGNVYNPHHATFTGMVPIQPFMNQFGGGYYPTGHGHGIYQNPGWSSIPQPKTFPGSWAQMSQPRLPFMAMLNLPDLSKLMNDPVRHDPSWPPCTYQASFIHSKIRRQEW